MFKKYFIKSIKKSKIDRIFYKIDKNGQNSFSLENYRFLTIFVDFCPFLSIFIHFCRFLPIFVDFYRFLSIFVHFAPNGIIQDWLQTSVLKDMQHAPLFLQKMAWHFRESSEYSSSNISFPDLRLRISFFKQCLLT